MPLLLKRAHRFALLKSRPSENTWRRERRPPFSCRSRSKILPRRFETWTRRAGRSNRHYPRATVLHLAPAFLSFGVRLSKPSVKNSIAKAMARAVPMASASRGPLPGAAVNDLRLAADPEKIEPFEERVKAASKYILDMLTGKVIAPAPVELIYAKAPEETVGAPAEGIFAPIRKSRLA